MKKIVVVIFVVLLMISGCSNKKSGEDGDAVTLTMFNADLPFDDPFDNPVAEVITEKTGVKLEITHPVGGDTEAIPVMIAGGNYPDLLFAKGDINKVIDADGLLQLDDLIEEKGDNLKAMYGEQINRLKKSTDDPHIYHVGTGGVENEYLTTSGTMLLQLDVLRELGYPEITTLEQYENAIQTYIEKYPEIDGQKTIGMSLLGSDWRWLITIGNPAGYVMGHQDDGQWFVDEATETASYKFHGDELKEYFLWLNGMYNKGLLDPESFTHGGDDYIAKLSSGRVLGIADQDWNFSAATAALRQEKEWRTYAPLPVAGSEDILVPSVKDYGFTGTVGISIAKDSKNAEKAFEFLDWMASEEAQILANWGVEGINYEIVDGKRVANKEDIQNSLTNENYDRETGVGLYIYPFPQAGTGALDSNGQSISRDNIEQIIENYSEPEKEVLSAYDAELWTDLFPSGDDFTVPVHGRAFELTIPSDSDLSDIQTRADDYMAQALTKLITVEGAKFNSVWQEIQDELVKLNIEKAEDEMTELVKDRIKLWTE